MYRTSPSRAKLMIESNKGLDKTCLSACADLTALLKSACSPNTIMAPAKFSSHSSKKDKLIGPAAKAGYPAKNFVFAAASISIQNLARFFSRKFLGQGRLFIRPIKPRRYINVSIIILLPPYQGLFSKSRDCRFSSIDDFMSSPSSSL